MFRRGYVDQWKCYCLSTSLQDSKPSVLTEALSTNNELLAFYVDGL